jgi:hypothetical protein
MDNPVECVAVLMGIIGGFFFPSVNSFLRVVGAIFWCFGNILWIVFANGHKKWAMLGLHVVYFAQNIFAIWNVSTGGIL